MTLNGCRSPATANRDDPVKTLNQTGIAYAHRIAGVTTAALSAKTGA
jgi:hypothetical protein